MLVLCVGESMNGVLLIDYYTVATSGWVLPVEFEDFEREWRGCC